MTINILLNGCEWKKSYVEKRLLKMFLTEDEVLMGYRHWSKYQCEIFNFVDLRIGWALCGRPQPEHDSAVMPLLSLFPLNVLTHQKSILCQETFSESGLLLETDRKSFFHYGRNRKWHRKWAISFGRNRNYAETHCSLTAVTETGSERMPNSYSLLIRPPHTDTQHTLSENIVCLTYVCLQLNSKSWLSTYFY